MTIDSTKIFRANVICDPTVSAMKASRMVANPRVVRHFMEMLYEVTEHGPGHRLFWKELWMQEMWDDMLEERRREAM